MAATPRPTAIASTRVHVVRPGEWLTAIAEQYGTTAEALIELNGLTNPDALEVGQVLELPPG